MFGRVYTGTPGIFGGRTEVTEVPGCRYRLRTEPFAECSVGNIEALPKLNTEDFGRVFTEKTPSVCFGTYPTEHTHPLKIMYTSDRQIR